MKLPPKKNIQLSLIRVKDDFHHLKSLNLCSIPESVGKSLLEQLAAVPGLGLMNTTVIFGWIS
jgi:hypothetical protein